MTATPTTRLAVYKWPTADDEFTRDQMNDSHQALEDKVALFTSGLFSARPAAGASNARGFYLATDTNVLYYSNGAAWFSTNSFASPSGLVPGDSNTDGGSTFAARADHKHSLPDWGVTGELAQIGTAAAQGAAVKFARIDHAHTLATGSVTSGKIATGAISAANLFTAQVVENAAIKDGAITKAKIATDQQNPAGVILAYGGISAPVGWVFCDGTSYDVSVQADLFTAIGYYYGGSGSTFMVPDLRGRVPVGLDNIGGTDAGRLSVGNSLGGAGGTETHQLTTAEMPVHTHAQTAHNHTQNSHNHTQNAHLHTTGEAATGGGFIAFAGGGMGITTSTGSTTATNQTATATNISATAVNQNAGSGDSHNNMQPFLLVNYIIKT